MTKETLIGEIVSANAEAIYEDSTQPSLQVLGKSLAQVVSLFATPVGRMAEIFEKNIHTYLDKLDTVDKEDIVLPDTRILVPVLEKMRYIDDNHVSEYYASILKSASHKEERKRVSVSLIEILNRLSSDELKILEYMDSGKNMFISKEDGVNMPYPIRHTLPLVDVKLHQVGERDYRMVFRNFSDLDKKIELLSPKNIPRYFDNMVSLGLLHVEPNAKISKDEAYTSIESHPTVIQAKEGYPDDFEIKFNRKK